jgi:hypothetical protein
MECHSREGGNPGSAEKIWTPAFAGVTNFFHQGFWGIFKAFRLTHDLFGYLASENGLS